MKLSQSLKSLQASLSELSSLATSQHAMIFDASGLPTGKIALAGLSGVAYGTCSTPAATAAKEAAIADFILLKNQLVALFFTTAIDVASPTLNISSTGAKPIYYAGSPLTQGVVRPRTIVILQYDGTRYNIVNIEGQEATDAPDELWVDMGLPSGLKWAKAAIDLTTESGFQEVDGVVSPYKYACSFFSWGNTQGYNPNASNSFSGVYNWGGVNDAAPYYDGQVYGSTPGNTLTASISPSFDAARVNLGVPWRMPTTEEYKELFDNIEYITADGDLVTTENNVSKDAESNPNDKRVTVNGINGLLLRSKINGSVLFFPCSGYGSGSSWGNRSSYGGFWSASFGSARVARCLYFRPSGVYSQNTGNRYYGFAVRPVQ